MSPFNSHRFSEGLRKQDDILSKTKLYNCSEGTNMLTIILNKFLSTFLTKYKTAMYKTAKVCDSVRFLELEVTYT